MLDSQFPSAVATVLEDDWSEVGSLEAELEAKSDSRQATPKQLDSFTLNQIILKLTDAAPQWGADATDLEAVPSTEMIEATHRLVELIEQLRSPNSGWPVDVPQIPETLLPYLLEEACEVQEALQNIPFKMSLPESVAGGSRTGLAMEQGLPPYWLVSELEVWLLWAIARSAYDVMSLMEGVSARVFQTEQGWQTGSLRLVAFLQINWAESADSEAAQLDLTTHQPVQTLLPSNAMVQAANNELCQEPIGVEGLLQDLRHYIQTITPSLTPIIHGVSVDALIPHQSWERSSIQLQLGLEFVANNALQVELASTADAKTDWSSKRADGIISQASTTNPVLRFTDLDWVGQYASTASRQQISSFMSWFLRSYGLESRAIAVERDPDQPNDALLQTVQMACKTVDFLQTAPSLANRRFSQRDWSINDVSLRLLWSFSRSVYAAMPLLTGIQSDVLEPGTSWKHGLLRLVVCLHVQTTELDWQLDLVTGDLESVACDALAPNAVVQLHHAGWQQQPIMLKDLRDRIMHYVQQTTPELQLFFSGTSIDVLDADHRWHPGTLHLSANFQFVPKRMHNRDV